MTRNRKILVVSFLLFVSILVPQKSMAAGSSMYFSPSSGTYEVGSTLSVGIFLSSTDQATNAVSGTITFPEDKLEVISLSKSGSIISLWVLEPSFSNNTGIVNFEAIVLNPGFTGSAGRVITINFRVKSPGAASVSFSSGSALANDGVGTNILESLGSASFSLGGAAVPVPVIPETTTPAQAAGVPSAPQISSPTHPDPNKWYGINDASFTWSLPSDVIGTRLLVDNSPVSEPTVTYSSAINSKNIPDLSDGIWFFHAQLQNSHGWGGVSHFRFQIDTKKPSSFSIQEVDREDSTEPSAKFIFNAADRTSGIDHYEIQIDNEEALTWEDDGGGIYETPLLEPGIHIMIVRAVDKAGNFLADSAEFAIKALEAPRITEYPEKLRNGETLTIKGTTIYPNIQVVVWLQGEKGDAASRTIRAEDDGIFIFTTEEKLKDGAYRVWAEVVDERGARSRQSDKVVVVVEKPALMRIGSIAISFFAVIIPLIALIILLIALILYGLHKLTSFKDRLRKDVKETDQALRRAFDLLRRDVRNQIKLLEKTKTKRKLTKEEEKIIRQLEKDLDSAEKSVRKEIKDIEEEIK